MGNKRKTILSTTSLNNLQCVENGVGYIYLDCFFSVGNAFVRRQQQKMTSKDPDGDYVRSLFRLEKEKKRDWHLHLITMSEVFPGTSTIGGRFATMTGEERQPYLDRAFVRLMDKIVEKKKLSTDNTLVVDLKALSVEMSDAKDDSSRNFINFQLFASWVTIEKENFALFAK